MEQTLSSNSTSSFSKGSTYGSTIQSNSYYSIQYDTGSCERISFNRAEVLYGEITILALLQSIIKVNELTRDSTIT